METTNVSKPILTATDKRWARILEDSLFYNIERKRKIVDSSHYGIDHPEMCLDIQATAAGLECYYTDGKHTTDRTFPSVEAFACLLMGEAKAHRAYKRGYPDVARPVWRVPEKSTKKRKARVPKRETKERLRKMRALALKHPEKELGELCQMAGIRESTFRRCEREGTFSLPPEYNLRRGRWRVKEDDKAALYRRLQSEIDAYCATHKRVSMLHLCRHLGAVVPTMEKLIKKGVIKVDNAIRVKSKWRNIDAAALQAKINAAAPSCKSNHALSHAVGIDYHTFTNWWRSGKITIPELKGGR